MTQMRRCPCREAAIQSGLRQTLNNRSRHRGRRRNVEQAVTARFSVLYFVQLFFQTKVKPIVIDVELVAAEIATPFHRSRHYSARTVYLSEHHLSDVDRIADAWQSIEPRRLSRSAVVRRAVEFLYAAVEADPAKSMLETE